MKKDVSQSTVDALVKILNEDIFGYDDIREGMYVNCFFDFLYQKLHEMKVYPNVKEQFILSSLPNVALAKNALLVYQMKEAQGYMNAVLAL